MEDAWRIVEGDSVRVYFTGTETLNGIVRHIAMATGDSWIIETPDGVYYVQTFDYIYKAKGE